MNIERREIKGTNYTIDRKGVIYSKTGRVVKPFVEKNGYLRVKLVFGNKRKHCQVSRLLYEAFYGSIEKGFQVSISSKEKHCFTLKNLKAVPQSVIKEKLNSKLEMIRIKSK